MKLKILVVIGLALGAIILSIIWRYILFSIGGYALFIERFIM